MSPENDASFSASITLIKPHASSFPSILTVLDADAEISLLSISKDSTDIV